MPYFAPPAFSVGRLVAVATTHLSLPGVAVTAVSTATLSNGQDRYFPILVPTPMTLDQLVCEVTTPGGAGTTIRMGIYQADRDWVPTSLVVDGGTVAADSGAVVAATINTTLAPGRYHLAMNTNSGASLRMLRGAIPTGIVNAVLSTSPFVSAFRATRAYAAFPATGTAITSVTTAATLFEYLMCVRVSVP